MPNIHDEITRLYSRKEEAHRQYLESREARDVAAAEADESLERHEQFVRARKRASRECKQKWTAYRQIDKELLEAVSRLRGGLA